MADEQTPQATDNTQFSGTSNAEQISDISTPQSNDSTVPTASAPNTPPQPQDNSQATPDKAPAPKPDQAPPAGQAPQVSAQPQPLQKLDDKNLKQEQTQVINKAPMTPQQQQQVQKASVWHTIAETLSGGPRYSYSMDEYGNMVKTKQNPSTAHLALAVAMEALQGAAIGLGQQGPNAAGKAAAAGFAAGAERVQKQSDADRAQGETDFKNRMLTTETNMRMYAMAKQIGKQDFDTNQAYVGQFKDLADSLQKDYPGFVQGPVAYKDFGKYNVTSDNAIPIRTVPRLDADGKQVVDNRGIPQYDNEYLIVKPGLKAAGLLNENDIKGLQDIGILPKGAAADLIIKTPMQLMQVLNLKSQLAQWGVGKDTYGRYYSAVDDMASGKTTVPQNMATITPKISSPTLDSAATNAANKFNVPEALVKGIMITESNGNPNAPDSKAHTGGGSTGGAIGPMQIMPETAQHYGYTDPKVIRDPKINVEIGTRYLADLMNSPNINGDPKLAAAAYIGGPGVVTADHKLDLSKKSAENKKAIMDYVDKFSKNIGLGMNNVANQAANQEDKPQAGTYTGQLNPATRMSLDDWNQKYLSTRKDNEAFLSILAHTENNYGQALKELETKDPKAAANMAAFLGGPDGIASHDLSVRVAAETRAEQMKVKQAADIAAGKKAQDEAAQTAKQDMLNTIEGATIPQDVLTMDPKDVIANLQSQSVTIPPEAIRDALSIAKYKEPETIASNKLWYKDKSFNQQDLVDLVHQFNPQYDQKNFNNLRQFSNPNSQVGKTIFAAAGVSNHLNMLLDAAKEVRDAGTGQTDFPALNKLMNALNYHVGGTGYAKLAALTQAVNGEMGKVLSGGFAPDKAQTEALLKNMTPANSYDQVRALTNLYVGVMHGKISPYDESYSQMTNGQHMDNIPASTSRLFRRLGYETPWVKEAQPPVPGAIAGRDPNTGEIKGWKLPDGRQVPVGWSEQGQAAASRAQNFVSTLR